ncbi:MAG: methionyl-tRNA formyltransferase [Lachnospiraceae bacterium]|nr:methionyl-tRNA formyltransferase [Lachnospiraceae bacterium]
MNIIFMGTPDFAVGALEAIIAAGHNIQLVVTQPDKAQGRSKELKPPAVKVCAMEHDLPVFQPEKIKKEESVAVLKQYEADLYVVAAFGQILSREILELPKFGCVNIHASLLPKYRGAAPIQWAVIDGVEKTGITIQQMNEGVDTGDILLQKEYYLAQDETGASLFDRLCDLGSEAIVEAISKIEEGSIVPVKQDESEATHAKMLTKSMGEIDFENEAAVIERLVRGLNSWPRAYTYYKGKTMKIWRANVVSLDKNEVNPGTVVAKDKESFTVVCGKDAIQILEIQPEGKRRMSVRDFMLGCKIELGEKLGN